MVTYLIPWRIQKGRSELQQQSLSDSPIHTPITEVDQGLVKRWINVQVGGYLNAHIIKEIQEVHVLGAVLRETSEGAPAKYPLALGSMGYQCSGSTF